MWIISLNPQSNNVQILRWVCSYFCHLGRPNLITHICICAIFRVPSRYLNPDFAISEPDICRYESARSSVHKVFMKYLTNFSQTLYIYWRWKYLRATYSVQFFLNDLFSSISHKLSLSKPYKSLQKARRSLDCLLSIMLDRYRLVNLHHTIPMWIRVTWFGIR